MLPRDPQQRGTGRLHRLGHGEPFNIHFLERDADEVALVSIMWGNNEVGTVQPVAQLAAVAREHGIPFHSDAVQAAAQLPVNLADSGATALTVTAHKLGGPVGVGALILGRAVAPIPVLHGGGQERDVRSGTLDAPAIRAFAVAAGLLVYPQAAHLEHFEARGRRYPKTGTGGYFGRVGRWLRESF